MPHGKTDEEIIAMGEQRAKDEHAGLLASGLQNCMDGHGKLVLDDIKAEIIKIATDADPWVDPTAE